MTVTEAYEPYRQSGKDGWGLAWYLACSVNQSGSAKEMRLGRFTMAGNVENWRTGSPGDHGCVLEERARSGEALSSLVKAAIRHLDLPVRPSAAHTHCHHKRRGESFVLLWEVAALVALRNEHRVRVWNHAFHTAELARQYDPEYASLSGKVEPPDDFLFKGG